MCRIRLAIFAILLGFCTAADIANADEAEAWTALHAGRHVALMRHTDAPGGAGDPPGFRVDDCATQRNLSAKGRADAARIGARLRSEGIAVERILSSPWGPTATLLELGLVEAEPTFCQSAWGPGAWTELYPKKTGTRFSGTRAPPDGHGCPSSRCGCRRFRANCFGSSAGAARGPSRSSAATR